MQAGGDWGGHHNKGATCPQLSPQSPLSCPVCWVPHSPTADSAKMVSGEVPRRDPITVATPSKRSVSI